MKLNKSVISFAVACALTHSTFAQETVIGEGKTLMGGGTAAAIRNSAKQEAIRDAVLKAIKDATALDASSDKFAPIVSEVAKQVRSIKVTSEEAVGGEFVTRVEALVDRKQIKNAIRGTDLDKLNDRSFGILMLVDEFVTNSRDINAPLEELVEYKYDAGSSFKDKSLKASAASSNSNSSLAASSSINAANASKSSVAASSDVAVAAQAQGQRGSAAVAGASSDRYAGSQSSSSALAAKSSIAATSSAKAESVKVDQRNVDAKSHETETYRKLVKYQDNSKPTNHPIFLNEFGGKLRDYDLRLLDATKAKSQFFGDKPITLATLSDSGQMTKFNEFARTKANADFLMMGSSTVIAGEKNPATGEYSCVVNAEVKAFATASAEMIASAAETMQASGMNVEGCAAQAAQKVARQMAPGFASSALGYWADRAARGRQFTVELLGASIPLPMRIAFSKALKEIDGATDVEKKEDSARGVKVTLTLKGKVDAMEQVFGVVSGQPAFGGKELDGTVEGELITLCIGKCGVDPAVGATAKGKKK